MNPAREEILGNVRMALLRRIGASVPPVSPSARVGPRVPGDVNSEIELLLSEIGKLGGATRRIGIHQVQATLGELVKAEHVKKAMLWDTPEIEELNMAKILKGLGVEIVSPQSDKCQLAGCDLGITGVDAAFPETGTLMLRSSPERPRMVSLLPRIHLAILHPAALRADLHPAFQEFKSDGYWVCITGPSRTADIELTLTIGVHGPEALHVWALDT